MATHYAHQLYPDGNGYSDIEGKRPWVTPEGEWAYFPWDVAILCAQQRIDVDVHDYGGGITQVRNGAILCNYRAPKKWMSGDGWTSH